MANTAALLGNLLNTNADINYYTQQSIFWNAKYEANSEKLQKQVKYEEKWEAACTGYTDPDSAGIHQYGRSEGRRYSIR